MEVEDIPFNEAEWVAMKITSVGLDIAKSVFHLVAMNQAGKVIKKKQLKRQQVLAYFAQLEPCFIAMEACGGANYWARELMAQGHEVKLISPQFVKPFVKGNKNDYNDAEGIIEAALRPTMRFVPIKTIEQQDIANIHRQRELIKKARKAQISQLRGLLAEYGIVINKGVTALMNELPMILEDAENGLGSLARELFLELFEQVKLLNERFNNADMKIRLLNRNNAQSQRLTEVLGIGETTASALYAEANDGKEFENGRHLSAWIGLVPKQFTTGGKTVLLGISKRGNTYLRTLLINGARAVLRHAPGKTDKFSQWALALSERRGHNKACVAIANKLARIAWVIMAKGEKYRPPAEAI